MFCSVIRSLLQNRSSRDSRLVLMLDLPIGVPSSWTPSAFKLRGGFRASYDVIHSGGNRARRINFSKRVVGIQSLVAFFWPKYWLQREDRMHLGPSRTSGCPLCVFIWEALDILSLKLKKEKKIPKRVFLFLLSCVTSGQCPLVATFP